MIFLKELSGFDECVGPTRFITNVIGVWPHFEEKQSFASKCVFIVPASLMFCLLVIPQSRKAISVRKDLNAVLEVLSTGIIMEALSILKLLGLWYNETGKRKIKNIIQLLLKVTKFCLIFCIYSKYLIITIFITVSQTL